MATNYISHQEFYQSSAVHAMACIEAALQVIRKDVDLESKRSEVYDRMKAIRDDITNVSFPKTFAYIEFLTEEVVLKANNKSWDKVLLTATELLYELAVKRTERPAKKNE